MKLSVRCILEPGTDGQGVLASQPQSLWQASPWEEPAGGPTAEFCLCVCPCASAQLDRLLSRSN